MAFLHLWSTDHLVYPARRMHDGGGGGGGVRICGSRSRLCLHSRIAHTVKIDNTLLVDFEGFTYM